MSGIATVIGTVGQTANALRSVASLKEPSWVRFAVMMGLGAAVIALFKVPDPAIAKYYRELPPKNKRAGNPGGSGKPKKTKPGGKKSKITSIMFVQKDCPYCGELRKELRDDIKAGRIEVVDVDVGKGKKMAEEFNVMRTPAMVPVVQWGKEKATIPPNTSEDVPIYRMMESASGEAKPREIKSPESKKRGTTKVKKNPEKKVASEEGYKSYSGQTRTSYCNECLVKHSSTAKELLKEAIDRSLKSGQGVEDKVRKAVDELNGMDDDLPQGEELPDDVQERFDHMDSERRAIRKQIYAKNLDISGGSKKELRAIQGRVSDLLDYAYETKKMVADHEKRKA